jgi:hypothetical protein
MKKIALTLAVICFAALTYGDDAKAMKNQAVGNKATCSASTKSSCCSSCCKEKKQAIMSPKAAAEKRG